MKIIAHRGWSARYPENTMLAFKKAIDAGADGIETDLRLSHDGRIMLFHDDDLKRLTGHAGSIETLSFEILRSFTIGEEEAKIAALDELLALVEGRVTLILEVKYVPATYRKLCQTLAEKIADKTDWVEVSCFEDRVLDYLHGLEPRIRLHKLIEKATVLEDEAWTECCAYVGYLDIDVALRSLALQKNLFEKYKIILWTVQKEDLKEEVQAGLYGIMVDDLS